LDLEECSLILRLLHIELLSISETLFCQVQLFKDYIRNILISFLLGLSLFECYLSIFNHFTLFKGQSSFYQLFLVHIFKCIFGMFWDKLHYSHKMIERQQALMVQSDIAEFANINLYRFYIKTHFWDLRILLEISKKCPNSNCYSKSCSSS
jgi:hypothetical protein